MNIIKTIIFKIQAFFNKDMRDLRNRKTEIIDIVQKRIPFSASFQCNSCVLIYTAFDDDSVNPGFDEIRVAYCVRGYSSRWIEHRVQYFAINNVKQAVECFINRALSSDSEEAYGVEDSKTNRLIAYHKDLLKLGINSYLSIMMKDFWFEIFQSPLDEVYCSKLIYDYSILYSEVRALLLTSDICLQHGHLITVLGDALGVKGHPDWESGKWIVDNYTHYKPIISMVEKEVLTKYCNIES